MPAVRAVAAVIFSALLALALAAPASAHPPRPTARDRALSDGCQRSDFGIGFDTSPEWVYVYRNPTIRMAYGVVRVPHSSNSDAVLDHRAYDFVANLVPAPAFRYLMAGIPSAQTNNFAPSEHQAFARLHFEWEGKSLPFFAWPTDGDRATIWGSWIWDCGHWATNSSAGPNMGGVSVGEHSELHPLNAIVVYRRAPYLSARGESEADAFISNDGTAAHAVEKCALSHNPVTPPGLTAHYDSGFFPCASSPANRIQPLERKYSFFVKAPPKPAPGALLRYRIVTRIPSSGAERIRRKAGGIEVTVTPPLAKHVVRYGKSFFVSWTVAPRHRPAPLKVRLKSILINQADPNPSVPDPSGAHWVLYLDVNGYWQLLNKWAPALTTHVTNGERIAINRTVKIYVPRRARVWFQMTGSECDEPAGKFETVFGITRYANLLYPCPANLDEQNPNPLLWFTNDDPGTILNIYRSARAAIGTHVEASQTTVNFPGTGPVSFGHGVEGPGNYQLTYAIRRG